MNSAKPPPPPPHRPATSKPPPPPPLRTSKPPSVPAGPATAHAHAAPQDPAHAHAQAPAPVASVAPPIVVAHPGLETRLRVSVKLSVRDPNLLLARPLREGEAPPPGTREAVLVLVEPAAEPDPRGGGAST
jgi:hypothetical protein